MEIKDLAGLGKGIEKLCDIVAKGIGVVYRPTAIRKEADAEAYKIRLLARAEAEADAEKRAILAVPADSPLLVPEVPLLQRAAARVAHVEEKKQINIENVVQHAANKIDDDVSDVAVDETWTTRFFASASEVSDELMQEVWGKVLAGEIKQPGSFGLRALEVLRNLTVAEADAFRRLCYLRVENFVFKTSFSLSFDAYGITYSDILTLSGAGLVHEQSDLAVSFSLPCVKPYQGAWLFMEESTTSVVEASVSKAANKEFGALFLTAVGEQLARLIEPSPNWDFMRAVSQHIGGALSVKVWKADVETNLLVPDEFKVLKKYELPSD
ncbi:DUF2806 domain-containing protein [Paraburkholderia nemoris]|uniref:DUF2806 domain-containing protein n=1 Tax=Paraburkholderia nemoris TaxID=2793076 RepID=UPI001B0F647A|nr:DUF2806 domain-containing protein [Paraburkholderia nemoris]CAE6693294.1 hypothetical protein LMG22931_00476 [Paraburkholderia nemoris]